MKNPLMSLLWKQPTACMQSDSVLLSQFIATNEPEAFTGLVNKHGPMVWAVCRNALRSETDAEDAFQAVFLVLLRSARRIVKKESIGAWLHGVAVRVCLKARQTSTRRLVRETRTAKQEITLERDTWHHDMTAVHECIKCLPNREREVFVLAMLEGVPQAEVAEQLGLKVNTISGLLARARKRLQTQLKQTEVLLALALAACIPSRAPAALVQSTCQLAIDATCLSKRVIQLTYSLGEVPMRKALMLGCLAAILCCGTTVGTFLLGNSEAQDFSYPQRPTQEVTQSKDEYRPAPASQKWEYKTIRVDTNLNDSVMNKLGEQGWELCATYSTPTGQVCLTFKRHSMSIATESRLGNFHPDANKRHSGETPSITSDYQVFHLKYSNAEEVAEILKQLMSGAKVHTDQRTNSLFVLVEEKQKNGIRQLIQRLDVEQTKQPPAKTDRRGALSDYFGR